MATVERSIVIAVPPEQLWQAFSNLQGWLAWNPHMREVRLVQRDDLAPGSRARIVLKTGFRSHWEVTELTLGRSFTWASRLLPGLNLAFAHEVERAGGDVRAVLRIEATGPLAALASPALRFIYSRNLQRSLENLKHLLEGGRQSPTAA